MKQSVGSTSDATPRVTPLAHAIGALLLAGGLAATASAQQAFSPAWFANKGVQQQNAAQSGRLPNGVPSNLQRTQQQEQAARDALNTSIQNLGTAAQAIAMQQRLQQAARDAARSAGSTVPNGLGTGGLQIDNDALSRGWINASTPTQQVQDGSTTVSIEQTADKAILNWETFNIGRDTTLAFKQDASWSVLNRVNDPLARPSQIHGQIKADGSVFVVNRNGVVFGANSQVNVRNLAAAAVSMSDAQFQRGLYSDGANPVFGNDLVATPTGPVFSAATGDVRVERGAQINTHAPASVTQGGGYVLLLGGNVQQHGQITTPGGQTTLAAGDAFVIRKGMGTDGNLDSTTRGNVVETRQLAPSADAAAANGTVRNTGLVQATTGDITLSGHRVEQQGVLQSTTSVHTRGTVHLDAVARGDEKGAVRLGEGSASAITLDESASTALDVQRETLVSDSARDAEGTQNRRDQSLLWVRSDGDVDFDGGSLTLATSGQVMVDAGERTQVKDGARIDVAGYVGVNIAMEANNVQVNVQGFEQRDASVNRDDATLNNSNVWLDRRDLVLVPAGTNGYATDRWYTAGGLLEVGGYLGVTGHGIGEWSAQGGSVRFDGARVQTDAGSHINLSGGTLAVQTGYVQQTFLKGADGLLYAASKAPGDLLYSGLYKGFEDVHTRWGATNYYYNPLIGSSRRLENGYVVGRDAGRMVVATGAASLQGEIETSVFQGDRQDRVRDAALDGYQQAQTAVAQRGGLLIGAPNAHLDAATQRLREENAAVVSNITIGSDTTTEVPAGTIALDAAWLTAQNFGSVAAYASQSLDVGDRLVVDAGGSIDLHASAVNIGADLVARGGRIALGDMVQRLGGDGSWEERTLLELLPDGLRPGISIGEGSVLDARGIWSNRYLDAGLTPASPWTDGGSVVLRSSGGISLGKGAAIDVSSGATLQSDDRLLGGRGGNIALASSLRAGTRDGTGHVQLDGELIGHGVKGGGTLDIASGTVITIGDGAPVAMEVGDGESRLPLRLAEDFLVQVGEVIPLDYTLTLSHIRPGVPSRAGQTPVNGVTYVLAADWVVTTQVFEQGKGWHYPGEVMAAGTSITSFAAIPAGTIFAADAFPNGIATQAMTISYKAGTVATEAVVLPSGLRLDNGVRLPDGAQVEPWLALSTDLFDNGFSNYAVHGRDGLVVAEGTALQVTMPVLQIDPLRARSLASGEDMEGGFSVVLPPHQQDAPAKATLALRDGASLTLGAGSIYDRGAVQIGKGSGIQVDPGQSITLESNDQLTVDGTLRAHGGRISLLPGDYGTGSRENAPTPTADARSFWIGEDAVLDVSGQAWLAEASDGRRIGQVDAGGTIEIGARHELGALGVDAVDAFTVIRPGAQLLANGAEAVLDIAGLGATRVASKGGTIALSSSRGLYVDGQLQANAGGAGAAGGTLALNLEAPLFVQQDRNLLTGDVENALRVPRELVIEQAYSGSGLGTDVQAGQSDDTLAYGHARYGVDAITSGGFGTAALLVNGLASFDGDVQLNLAQALYLTASAFGLSEAASRDARVDLRAGYLRVAGTTRPVGNEGSFLPNPINGSKNQGMGFGTMGPPPVAADAVLHLGGNLVDVQGTFGSGSNGELILNGGITRKVVRDGFGLFDVRSEGDLRLRDAAVYLSGNTRLAAAQIHGNGSWITGLAQVTNQFGTLVNVIDPDSVLDIERVGDVLPAQPYSVFGRMSFGAGTINQGGVLRAPLGTIELGQSASLATGQVNLLPGSVTSVSANGLVMPYGGTADNLAWALDGTPVKFAGLGAEPMVSFAAQRVDAQDGAVIDLSGGGTLTGAAFISGRGGSTDARLHPLVQMNADGFQLPSLSTNPVYAIVPGTQAAAAPLGGEAGAGAPAIGRQITLGEGVPGLPAGTYTLLPSSYALLPGAFRVELNGLAGSTAAVGRVDAIRNGSFSTSAVLGNGVSGLTDALPSQVVLTSADTLRRYASYNETSYSDFALAQAEREGVVRPLLERDAKALELRLRQAVVYMPKLEGPTLQFQAEVRDAAADGGTGSVARVFGQQQYEILADGASPTEGFTGLSIHADALNAIGAHRLEIGGRLSTTYTDFNGSTQQANVISVSANPAWQITLRSGALLEAAEVFLMTGWEFAGITVEQGAGISTLGRGASDYDASKGYVLQPGKTSLLALSNGALDVLAPTAGDGFGVGPGSVLIGGCDSGDCSGETRLYSEGTLAVATDNRFELDEAVRYGARHLSLSVGGINIGTSESLAQAEAAGTLPSGLALTQQLLDRLLRGDASVGAPALETLSLVARDSVNFHGNVVLDTYDAAGESRLQQMVFGAPAFHGAGDAGTVAGIRTDTFIWSGAWMDGGTPVVNGPGNGSGTLQVDAREVVFGYAPHTQQDTVRDQDRLALGFANVVFNASERVTSNRQGSLSVFQSQGAWNAQAAAFERSGGNLQITTPLLTGDAGSSLKIAAGGDIRVQRGVGQVAGQVDAGKALGAELALDSRGGSLLLDTTVGLPSGRLLLAAEGDVQLGAQALLDLAGQKIDFNDVAQYAWGGDVRIDSRHGDIVQDAASRIDLSASNNRAGELRAAALDGSVDLRGTLLGSSSGEQDAGGTKVPFSAGRISLQADQIVGFEALNQRLGEGGVFGGRSFRIGSGDLVVGDGIKASDIEIALDGGQLTVTGLLDASGAQAGSIRLAARDGVTVAGSAVLDASADVARRDSYGQLIDAANRADIEIDAGSGRLVLQQGARLDLGVAGSDQSHGVVTLNAPRIGADDVAIDAAGTLDIRGARAINLNAFIRDSSAALGTEATTDGKSYQVVDQAYLDRLHLQSDAFIDAALGNGDLVDQRLAGLRAQGDAFHLRPGVEVVADTTINADGNLAVDGDIDLSGHRYNSLGDTDARTGVRGSGEAGALVLRAEGDLNIYGSISDGFDVTRVPTVLDDRGWLLNAGRQPFSGDTYVPHAGLVTLAAGTLFETGKVLNYDVPIAAMTYSAGTLLPAEASLAQDLALVRGTVLGGDVHAADGSLLYRAGSVIGSDVVLPSGTRLGAGMRLGSDAQLAAMTWPAGTALPRPTAGRDVALAADVALGKGAFIPGETLVVLPDGAKRVELRPADAEGNQGRQWALAPMLEAGSRSWDITLVGGADTAAADRLAVVQDSPHGVRLADVHYGVGTKTEQVPGTGVAGEYRWADDADVDLWAIFGFNARPGEPFTAEDFAADENWGFIINGDPRSLNDLGFSAVVATREPVPPEFREVAVAEREQVGSVLRTGTGDLRLVAGADIAVNSLYGVYTAGSSTTALGVDDAFNQARAVRPDGTVLGSLNGSFEGLVNGGSASLYQAWYPDGGGDLLLRAGGNISGDSLGASASAGRPDSVGSFMNRVAETAAVGNWLWRQGSNTIGGDDAIPTAWWINFGTYVASPTPDSNESFNGLKWMPRLLAFNGFGTLGGGNLRVDAQGDAGRLVERGDHMGQQVLRSSALDLVVASTGRIDREGRLQQTGGGDLDIRLGGGLNPVADLNAYSTNVEFVGVTPAKDSHGLAVNGALVNLRGALNVQAADIGTVELVYGGEKDGRESRALDVFAPTTARSAGGPTLVLGDATAQLDARGDVVVSGAADPGRVRQFNGGTPFWLDGLRYSGEGVSWFSMWTPSTAIDLFAAGGNLTPNLAYSSSSQISDASAADGNAVYPSILRMTAASGSVFHGRLSTQSGSVRRYIPALVVAPTPQDARFSVQASSELDVLARDSIYANGLGLWRSSADGTALPSIFNPAFAGQGPRVWYGAQKIHNLAADALAPALMTSFNGPVGSIGNGFPLFSFTAPNASGAVLVGQAPARYYAMQGDIVGLRTGSITYRGAVDGGDGVAGSYSTWYDGSVVAIRAGRDIVNAGTSVEEYDRTTNIGGGALGWTSVAQAGNPSAPGKPGLIMSGSVRGNLLVHTSADDVSVVSAGRDILTSTFYVGGPGLLDISAGRNLYMGDVAEVRSIGGVVPGASQDRSSGASIAITAGIGAAGADWNAFADRYLDPANQADLDLPLADQAGKAVVVYGGSLSLAQWLQREFGYSGDEAGAPAFLQQQQVALDQARAEAIAQGRTASSRALSREFASESQLYLVNWLSDRFGGSNRLGLHFDAASTDARAFFDALPVEQRSAYLRKVYYAELKASGREYNDADGRRAGSYLRGREAIATLLPEKDGNGAAIVREGDLTMFSGARYYRTSESAPTRQAQAGTSYVDQATWIAVGRPSNMGFYTLNDAGIHTDFGGDIDLMVPGGRTLVGVEGGFTPGAGSGVLTQGTGDINVYSLDSLLLGQSRMFTTFGGSIFAWSAEGDINAGRGSKTTVVHTPQRRVYDSVGNVELSPSTPNTGAGIATLNPIAEIPPGDIDLVAPLGTIDAGEAGIRVSGNVNLAALRVVNAENIVTQGESTGIPMVASVNVNALAAASSAATSAVQAAQDMVRQQTQQARPSVISVQVLGFGDATSYVPAERGKGYDADSVIQVVGMGTPASDAQPRGRQ
ncbi:TPA: filamentous hemagglutinin family protein [Stenotrophomonas maltophilia]|nr:filamentous hemagglutinin family protein [Stenotrophomonas maltophilia]